MRQALIKKPKEIELIAEGGKLLAKILDEVLAAALLGITTQELDAMAEQKIRACPPFCITVIWKAIRRSLPQFARRLTSSWCTRPPARVRWLQAIF